MSLEYYKNGEPPWASQHATGLNFQLKPLPCLFFKPGRTSFWQNPKIDRVWTFGPFSPQDLIRDGIRQWFFLSVVLLINCDGYKMEPSKYGNFTNRRWKSQHIEIVSHWKAKEWDSLRQKNMAFIPHGPIMLYYHDGRGSWILEVRLCTLWGI